MWVKDVGDVGGLSDMYYGLVFGVSFGGDDRLRIERDNFGSGVNIYIGYSEFKLYGFFNDEWKMLTISNINIYL